MDNTSIFKRNKQEIILSGALITVLTFTGIFWNSINLPLILYSPEKLADLLGPYGPTGIIIGQFIQVLIAPIPPITPVASGLLYGPWYGMIFSVAGASLGSILAIILSRKYGRPLVERFVRKSIIERFDSFTEKTGYTPFIVLFIFPGFPDDALCFIAGLTKLDWKNLAIIASLGRIPGILMLTTTGHSIAETKITLFIIASSSVVILSILSIKYRRTLENYLKLLNSKVNK